VYIANNQAVALVVPNNLSTNLNLSKSKLADVLATKEQALNLNTPV